MMKIEKLNDNQIRCTLTHADLVARELKLSELAYGTEKAKSLFHDMMQQAAFEFGFEADDIPLMIEAIPSSSDSIVLIITKVEDPEELDTRFSKFAPAPSGESDGRKASNPDKLAGAEDFLELLGKVKEAVAKPPEKNAISDTPEQKSAVRLFSFISMDSVIRASKLLDTMYYGANTLYKDTVADIYILALAQSNHTTNEFNKFCNMLSEYGSLEKSSGATLAYLEEHGEVIVQKEAVQQLANI